MNSSLKLSVAAATLMLASAGIRGEEPKWYDTTDHFAVHGLRHDDLGDFFTVALEGTENHYYMAYNLDIMLPAGVTCPITSSTVDGEYSYESGDVYHNMEDGLYPTTYVRPAGQMPNHLLSNAVKDNGTRIKVICFSPKNELFLKPVGSIFDCYVKVHPLAKAGINDVKMRDMVFNTKNTETGYPIQWAPGNTLDNVAWTTMEIPAERTVEVSVSATDKWATLILPFALDALPENVTAYTAIGITNAGEVELEAVTSLAPYKPYIINAPQGWTATLTGTASADDFPSPPALYSDADEYTTPYPADVIATNGVLCANIKPHSRTDGHVLTVGDGIPAFSLITEAEPKLLDTGDVYLPMPKGLTGDAPQSRPLKLVGSDSPITSLSVVAADVSSDPQPIYNLQGVPVTNPQPGNLYITRGRIFRK